MSSHYTILFTHRSHKRPSPPTQPAAIDVLETRQLMTNLVPVDSTNMSTHFDGANDYIDLGNSLDLQLKDSLSVSAWVNTPGGKEGRILSKGNSTRSFAFNFGLTSDNRLTFGFSPDGQTGSRSRSVVYQSTAKIAVNEWVHLTATFDRGSINAYIDGTPVDMTLRKGDGSSRGPKSIFTGGNVRIGKEGLGKDYPRHFNGQLEEVSI